MSETKSVNFQFGSLAALLTMLFVGLKLTGHVTWSWIWVLAPLWIGAGLTVIMLVILLVMALAIAYASSK